MKNSRIRKIKELLINKKQVYTTELCEQFCVSLETARRDLNELEKEGFIQRFYGGARLADASSETVQIEPWESRSVRDVADKKRIAAQVMNIVPDGCTVYLDSGTSAYEMLPLFRTKKNLTILTPSLRNAAQLAEFDNLSVYMIGGLVSESVKSSVGFFAKEFLSTFYRIDYALVSCDAFNPAVGASEYSAEMADLKQIVLGKAARVIAFVDHSKFGLSGNRLWARADQLDVLVTDSLAPVEAVERLRQMGVRVLIAEEEEAKRM